ncbi:hypothetical protein GCM10022258_21440 [Aquimarina gracilis]
MSKGETMTFVSYVFDFGESLRVFVLQKRYLENKNEIFCNPYSFYNLSDTTSAYYYGGHECII